MAVLRSSGSTRNSQSPPCLRRAEAIPAPYHASCGSCVRTTPLTHRLPRAIGISAMFVVLDGLVAFPRGATVIGWRYLQPRPKCRRTRNALGIRCEAVQRTPSRQSLQPQRAPAQEPQLRYPRAGRRSLLGCDDVGRAGRPGTMAYDQRPQPRPCPMAPARRQAREPVRDPAHRVCRVHAGEA